MLCLKVKFYTTIEDFVGYLYKSYIIFLCSLTKRVIMLNRFKRLVPDTFPTIDDIRPHKKKEKIPYMHATEIYPNLFHATEKSSIPYMPPGFSFAPFYAIYVTSVSWSCCQTFFLKKKKHLTLTLFLLHSPQPPLFSLLSPQTPPPPPPPSPLSPCSWPDTATRSG